MKDFNLYFITIFFGLLILVQIGKIVYVLFHPRLLDRPLFHPPHKKFQYIIYYLSAIFVLLFYILARNKVI